MQIIIYKILDLGGLMKNKNGWALLPIGIFVVLYLALGIIFE